MSLNKDQILSKVALRTIAEPSALFGGDLCLQELSRAAFRATAQAARIANAEDGTVDTDRWNGGLFAAIVVDEATKQPLFTLDDVLAMANRADVWDEILRVATIGLNFSEVGQDALKKTSSDSPAVPE
jgi:hypothetical protein